MLKKFFLFTFLLSAFVAQSQQDTLRVLFLGNSYTGVNNLPNLCKNLADADSNTLIIGANTPGGHTLDQHSTNVTSNQRIQEGNWDFVVLQEQSQVPTIPYFKNNLMYPGARRLRDSILKHNPCARIVMYMTWGRRFGGQQCSSNGAYCSPNFVDFSHMQDSLESAYVGIAKEMNAFVAPVGVAWKNVLNDTNIVLHSSDNSHPNLQGSYIAATVFHSVFWNKSPISNSYTSSLSPALAKYLQERADTSFFQASTDWNSSIDTLSTAFVWSSFGQDTIEFQNNSSSIYPSTFYWDFGDSSSSSIENPQHIYAQSGVYNVRLIHSSCGKLDTTYGLVRINSGVSLQESLIEQSMVYPNPSSNHVNISWNPALGVSQVIIYDLQGNLIESYSAESKVKLDVDVEKLHKGIYILSFKGAESQLLDAIKLVLQ